MSRILNMKTILSFLFVFINTIGTSQTDTVTQIQQCGTTLSAINQPIVADIVPNAELYRFRVTNTSTNVTETLDFILRVFRLTQLTIYEYDTVYTVEVAVRLNGVWNSFSEPCFITTPLIFTKIQDSQCPTTLSTFDEIVYANLVPFAKGYRFRVTNILNPLDVQIIDRLLREFRMSFLINPVYNNPYSVEVAVKNNDGTYLPYGEGCIVTTPFFPTTEVQLAQCDYTPMSKSELIYANPILGATIYRFKLENASHNYFAFVDRAIRTFHLNMFPNLIMGETYTVKVAVMINGELGPYGKACTITVPIVTGREGVEQNESIKAVVFYPNPFSDSFNVSLNSNTQDIIYLSIYDVAGRMVYQNEYPSSQSSNVEVNPLVSSGIYSVILRQSDSIYTFRIVKN